MQPLVFFVHVPKTAGSTINAYLKQEMPNGHPHCEALIDDDGAFRRAAEESDWLSGHVDLSTAQARLATVTSRPVRYFTCMRAPSAHVMSHYNWLIEIYHKGAAFYDSHPDQIKAISSTIRSSPNDAESIIENLARFPGLFKNTQSRWVLGSGFDWNQGDIHKRLDEYECVVDNSNIGRLLEAALGRSVSADERRENASAYHFDAGVISSQEMECFLAGWNTLDEILFRIVASRGERHTSSPT